MLKKRETESPQEIHRILNLWRIIKTNRDQSFCKATLSMNHEEEWKIAGEKSNIRLMATFYETRSGKPLICDITFALDLDENVVNPVSWTTYSSYKQYE